MVLLVLLCSACVAPKVARRDVVIGLVGEPASVFADEPNARLLAAAVTEQLVRRDAHDDFVARLAAAVPTFENGGLRAVTDDPTALDGRLVATFELRPGLRWQDGQPITSDDVRFAWETDRAAPAGTDARWVAERVERVEVLDPVRVRFVYRAGERWDGYATAARVLPRHLLLDASAADRARYDREPVHAGPFAVAAWLPGIGITLSAYRGYALGAPAIGRLEIHFFPDRGALLDALRRGEVDVAPSPALEADLTRTLDRFADGGTLQTYYTPSEAIEVLRFGARFADPALRRAVELAVDRGAIVRSLFAGRALVAKSYLVPPLWAAAESGPAPRPDRAAAAATLAAAGFTHGTFGILERSGVRLVVALLVGAGSPARLEAARLVAGDLAAIGIAVEVRERPAPELAAALADGAFDLAIGPQLAGDPQQATAAYAGQAGPWFDTLAAAAAAGPDRTEKRPLYTELARLWSAGPAGVALYQRLLVDVAPRDLAGIQPVPAGEPLTWNVREWHFGHP
ncbi:MAG: hypothetical protein NVS9B6_07270 [Candidatus Limnocylindrales bacterium]